MKLTIFAKSRKTNEGRTFISYFTKLKKTDGTEINASVKFKDCEKPDKENCPIIVIVNKENANLSNNTVMNEATGEYIVYKTLWINKWEATGEKFVDHSLDDIAD